MLRYFIGQEKHSCKKYSKRQSKEKEFFYNDLFLIIFVSQGPIFFLLLFILKTLSDKRISLVFVDNYGSFIRF